MYRYAAVPRDAAAAAAAAAAVKGQVVPPGPARWLQRADAHDDLLENEGVEFSGDFAAGTTKSSTS
jgi:hypothetical protein